MLWGMYNGYRVGLVQTIDDLTSVRRLFEAYPKTIVGGDTETTGLCYLNDHVVGVCLSGGRSYSKSDYCGFYLPIRHAGYMSNLPVDAVFDLVQWVLDNRTTFWWNRNFDFSMIEKEGVRVPFVGQSHDIQAMAHEVYNEKYPRLKDFAKRLFKFQTIEFSDNNAKNNNFGCFADDTEFLTPLGFRRFDAISEGQRIAQYNPVTGGLEFVVPTRRYSYTVQSTTHLQGAFVDSLMTDNHRVYLVDTASALGRPTCEALEDGYCCEAWSLYGRDSLSVRVGTTGLVGRPYRAFYSLPTFSGGVQQVRSASFWALCGLLVGGCHAMVDNTMLIGVSTGSAASCISSILDQLGYPYKTFSLGFEIQLPAAFSSWFLRNFTRGGATRLPLFLRTRSQRERRFFLRGFLWSMGCLPSESSLRGSSYCWTLEERLHEDLSCLLTGLGIAHTTRCLGLCSYEYTFASGPIEKLSAAGWSREGASRVVCFSVPSSLLIVRRRGKTFISGNSTDPETTFVYAAADPLITTLCGLKIWSDYSQVHKIYATDNLCGEAVRRLTQEEIFLDFTFLKEELMRASQSTEDVRMQIYQFVGYPFNINSNREVVDALSRFVTLTVRTKSGGFKIDKEILASIDHPLAKLLLSYSGWSTYQKFVEKMSSWAGTQVRFNYNTVVALTGRLSSSASEGNNYYKAYNATNCPKVEVKGYLHEDPLLGFKLTETADGCLTKDGSPIRMKTKAGLRKAFIPNPQGQEGEWVMLGCDYCVHPDTIVTTQEYGRCRIGDLVGKDVNVLTPYGYRKAVNVHHTELRQCVVITLADGHKLTCSREHRLWVRRDGVDCWVQVKDLRGDEYVYTDSDVCQPEICL